MATLGKIQAQMKRLQEKAEAILKQRSNDALEEIQRLMQQHQLSVADIERHVAKKGRRPSPTKKRPKPGVASSAVYRHPESGNTWSGRGRPPAWILDVKDRGVFLVVKSGTGKERFGGERSRAKPAAKKVAVKKVASKSLHAGKMAAKRVAAKKATPTVGGKGLPGMAPGTGPGYSPASRKARK